MLKSLINGLVEIIYPRKCLGCGKKASLDTFVCPECNGGIKRNTPPFCLSCGRHLDAKNNFKNICNKCIRTAFYFDRAFSPCAYEGIVRELILEFKYKNKDYLGKFLAELMAEFIEEYKLPVQYIDYIVPVPLHKTRLREREFNQAALLARHLAKRFDKPVLEDALIRQRQTRSQTELSDKERFSNISGSFRFAGETSLKGKNILLIDDVLTTGATLSEAARLLKECGAGAVFCLTLAN